jgi:hypothetical protein
MAAVRLLERGGAWRFCKPAQAEGKIPHVGFARIETEAEK